MGSLTHSTFLNSIHGSIDRTEIFSNNDESSNTSQSTPASQLAVRRLEIAHKDAKVEVSIPQSLYSPALALRANFLSVILTPAPDRTWEGDPANGGEVLARFLDYLIGQIEQDFLDFQNAPHAKLLSLCLDKFEDGILRGNDIHPVVASWSTAPVNKQWAIRAYLRSRHILERPDLASRSALLNMVENGDAKVYAVFGGQGANENYFNELRDVWKTYNPWLQGHIAHAAGHLNRIAKDYPEHYAKGLDILQWLADESTQPDNSYLIGAPVSFPLIGLIQLCNVFVNRKCLGAQPSHKKKLIAGATGHSQGLIIAAVVSAAGDWEEFSKWSINALTILVSIGCRTHEVFPPISIDHTIIEDSVEHGEGVPTPMLSVRDLPPDVLRDAVDKVNEYLPYGSRIEFSLQNGPRNIVVTGPRVSLVGLNVYLRDLKAPPGLNQDKLPFNERKPNFNNRFLPISAPFHSTYLTEAVALVEHDLASKGLALFADDLRVPVYSTTDGTDLRDRGSINILPEVVKMIILDPLNWENATKFPDATHILDFGPGGTSGIGVLTSKLKQGCGIRTVLAGILQGSNPDVGYKPEIFDANLNQIPGVMWSKEYQPSLVRTSSGQTIVDTKMSRLLKLPPVMVAGMTPTTVSWEFVAATMSAGYHIELAAGGYNTPEELSSAVRNIVKNTPAGRAITINIIYASPHSVRWQIPLITELKQEGLPIESITFGAGVPSVEIANGYIKDMDLKFISFKPSSVSSIQQVLDIARANPTFPIMLQWTGGRGGGHHSFEAFHQSITEMYGSIRSCANVILVAGSGLGGAEDSYHYLSGNWSLEFGHPIMPFDGVLFGSRVMVAKETATSPEAKQLIVDTEGVEDGDWHKTYKGAAGGIITVVSEMGEPIHKIATRGVLLWAEMDKTIFSIKDKTKRLQALQSKKDYIIKRLNSDFAKPWFGKCHITGNPIELEEMTYHNIIERFISLTYVDEDRRWVHPSYKKLLHDFIGRAEARFVGTRTRRPVMLRELEDPFPTIKALFEEYPMMKKQVIIYQDTLFFIALCRRRGQKPVPFIPILDETFETWFKKDSLWQSEDIKAVQDHDVQRTCILQGPVAVRYSTIVDEPIKDLLDGVHSGHIQRILKERYDGEISNTPRVDCFGLEPPTKLDPVYFKEQGNVTIFEVPPEPEYELPDTDTWLSAIGGPTNNWRRAFFTAKTIVSDHEIIENPIRRLFIPMRGTIIKVDASTSEHAAIVSQWEERENGEPIKTLEIRAIKHNVIAAELLDDRTLTKRPVGLVLLYNYHPEASWAPIQEVVDDRSDRIKDFYHMLWFGEPVPQGLSMREEYSARHEIASDKAITKFARCIGNFDNAYRKRGDELLQAPLDFAIVVAWKSIMKPLFGVELDADLLKLVHLSNSFYMIDRAPPIVEGDILDTRSRITAVVNQDTGKRIQVEGTIFRDAVPIIKISSAFFIRKKYETHENTYEETEEIPYEISLKSAKDVGILQEKKWFHLHNKSLKLLGKTLLFKVKSKVEFESKDIYSSMDIRGTIMSKQPGNPVEIGIVAFKCGRTPGNPVLDYLRRHGTPADGRIIFENPIPLLSEGATTVQTPASNEAYAAVSGDFNPIHVSKPMMAYIQLRGTITHGMYTSAMVRSILEKWVCPSQVELFRGFKCSFTGMVLPKDELEIQFYHIGMVQGRKIIKVEAKQKTTGQAVLIGEAEIDPPTTAYVFTGQGSQQVGMGMELYAKSPAAKAVWDFADDYFLSNYGFKITDIVKNNPKELTIHFGGRHGRKLRENYMALKHEVREPDGRKHQEPIFASITEDTDFYTYRSELGLLFATQFTQPALTLMEKAIFEDMRARGLISKTCSYAGHSLGEYSALTCMTDILPLDACLGLVFYRGLTIQVAVERDEKGRSNFAMCAVDPTRVTKEFDEPCLQFVIKTIVAQHNWLLEVVNYNVANLQYVCAGDLRALHTLGTVCNTIKKQNLDIKSLIGEAHFASKETPKIIQLIQQSCATAAALPRPIKLTRGVATIPLAIDVPFHSSFLKPGVVSYRQCLMRNIKQTNVNVAQLEKRYIPNLTAKPFEVTKDYFEKVYDLTGSEVLGRYLEQWNAYEKPRRESVQFINSHLSEKLAKLAQAIEKGKA